MIRHTVLFSGHVQGVGFRYTAKTVAMGFAVAGYVRNLEGRRVEMVVEGEAAQARAMVEAVSEQMGPFIKSKTVAESPATGEFGRPEDRRFEIRR